MTKISEILKVGDKFNDFIVVDIKPIIIDRRQQIQVKCKCGRMSYIRPDYLILGKNKSCWNCSIKKRKGKITCFVGQLCSKTYNDCKRNAIVRNLEFNVSMEQLWQLFENQKGKCALSGIPIKLKLINWNEGKGSRKEVTASLDRINNSKGYTIDNVQWVHKCINIMKGCMSDEQFIYICNKVAENSNFEYENAEPSLTNGWLPRMNRIMGSCSKEGVTTSSLNKPINNENHERSTSQVDEEIV